MTRVKAIARATKKIELARHKLAGATGVQAERYSDSLAHYELELEFLTQSKRITRVRRSALDSKPMTIGHQDPYR